MDVCLDAGAHDVRLGRRLFGRHRGGDPRPGDQGPPGSGAHFDQGRRSAIGDGPNDVGSSRYHLHRAVEASLRRLGTDYIDLYQLHGFDADDAGRRDARRRSTTWSRQGKIRYVGCSNFSGWHLMKSLAVADAPRLVPLRGASGLLLAGRPRLRMGADAAGARPARRHGGVEPARLGPVDRQDPPRTAAARGEPPAQPAGDRRRAAGGRRACSTGWWTRSTRSRADTGKTVPQVAINWLLRRPSVSTRDHRRAQRGAVASESGRRRAGRWRPSTSRVSTPPARSRRPIRTGTSGVSPSATPRRSSSVANGRAWRPRLTATRTEEELPCAPSWLRRAVPDGRPLRSRRRPSRSSWRIMTWFEIRDAMAAGKTTAIIYAGGTRTERAAHVAWPSTT